LGQEYGSAAAEWLVDSYDDAYTKKKKELEDLNDDINRYEDMDKGSEAASFVQQFESLTGKRMEWDEHVAEGTDDNREFLYYETETDEEGKTKKVEKRLSYQDMIEEMAVAYALME
jgi:hypothetical protein